MLEFLLEAVFEIFGELILEFVALGLANFLDSIRDLFARL